MKERWNFRPWSANQVGKQIWGDRPPEDWWQQQVTALCVQPVRGGDGGYHPNQARIWLEAMLTDVDALVPEVLRVAWLVTSMAIDSYARQTSSDLRLMQPWLLASVPLVLNAGSELELVRGDRLPINEAMKLWRFGDDELGQLWHIGGKRSAARLPCQLA